MRRLAVYAVLAALSGCVIYQTPPPAPPAPPADIPPQAEAPPSDEPTPAPDVSVYVEPPVAEPAPIAVGWAPPPMLVEVPPPLPYAGAVWVGGYWVWQGNWVWAHGHWMAAPRPDYVWVHPYYEHRGDAVIFIDGYWSPRSVAFVPPPVGMRFALETPAVGVIAGPRPIGPEGCFVPAPPGSRRGIIIPAPVGTAPAVVTSAPAVVAPGMRITNNVTTVNNVNNKVTNVTNITKVTNVTNVTIVAPPAATGTGHEYKNMVPAAPHLAAARPALVQARAPEPVNTRPLPVYTPGSRPPVLPHPVSAGPAAPPVPHPQPGSAGPGAAPGPHPPTVSARDPQPAHVNPDQAHTPPYGEAYGHQAQPQNNHKAPPGQTEGHPVHPQRNDYRPPQQAQSASSAQPPQAGHSGNGVPQQPGHQQAAPQQAAPQQAAHQPPPAHAENGNRGHKGEAQADHDGKHDHQSNERSNER
jgi:hypothetical protein